MSNGTFMCEHCGAENNAQAKFCGHCGASFDAKATQEQETEVNGVKKTRGGKKRAIAIAAVLVALAVGTILLCTRKPVIDMNKYVEIQVDGVNGYGCAEVIIDSEAFYKNCANKIRYANNNEIAEQLSYLYPSAGDAFLEVCFQGALSSDRHLSNGDTVEYVWNLDFELVEEVFRVKLDCSNQSQTVQGLKEIQMVDITPYISIQCEGYNGFGSATASFDCDAFVSDYQDVIEYNQAHSSADDYSESYDCAARSLVECHIRDVSVDEQGENLSNGDSVTAIWSYNEDDLLELYGVRLTCSQMEYTVDGLEKLEIVNLFHYITVSYSGVEGNGKVHVSIDRSVDFMKKVNVDVRGDYDLTNGSKITLEIEKQYLYTPTYFAQEYGVKPVGYEQEYTVSGLLEYASTVDEITEEATEAMKRKTESMIDDIVSDWVKPDSCKGKEYVGLLLLKHKDIQNMWSGNKNEIYVIYRIDVAGTNGDFSYYYAARFSNIYCDENGACVVDISTAYRGNASFLKWQNSRFLTYYGYETWDALIDSLVPSSGSSYRYDATFDVT